MSRRGREFTNRQQAPLSCHLDLRILRSGRITSKPEIDRRDR